MSGFFRSFQPLLKKSEKYLSEMILLAAALMITVIASVIYMKNSQSPEEEIQTSFSSDEVAGITRPTKIFVDASGAVKKPNVYEVSFGARLKDVIDKAGGLSDEADTVFFNRNFNLARVVADQEKIYIPSTVEINNGIFIQNQRTLDYISPATSAINNASATNTYTDNQLININFATIEELDQLPGVGKITAEKIIKNRPYTAIEELLMKKAVNKSQFEKIKELIAL